MSDGESLDVDQLSLKDDGYFKEVVTGEEVSIYPDKVAVVLNDGTEIEGSMFIDYWENIFAKNKKKNGYVHFKFTKMAQVDNVKDIKMTFRGHKKGSEESKVEH